jgi:hypothetical protein
MDCPNHKCAGHTYDSDISSFNLLSSLSTGGIVAGGVLAATGLVVVLTAPKARPPRDAWIAPVIGAGYGGVEGGF